MIISMTAGGDRWILDSSFVLLFRAFRGFSELASAERPSDHDPVFVEDRSIDGLMDSFIVNR